MHILELVESLLYNTLEDHFESDDLVPIVSYNTILEILRKSYGEHDGSKKVYQITTPHEF